MSSTPAKIGTSTPHPIAFARLWFRLSSTGLLVVCPCFLGTSPSEANVPLRSLYQPALVDFSSLALDLPGFPLHHQPHSTSSQFAAVPLPACPTSTQSPQKCMLDLDGKAIEQLDIAHGKFADMLTTRLKSVQNSSWPRWPTTSNPLRTKAFWSLTVRLLSKLA